MPSERAITSMIDVLNNVIELGGTEERTAIVPNLSVIDAAPTGLTNFIIVQDDRDGDNILAKTVPGVVYANSDKVNVLFIKGAEPIAFQQGSESSSANLWQIVPSTSTDIFYNSGDVGIGKSVAPDASLEILDTAQAQLRLTHTEDTKFVDFTLDTNHDLTITPSSTGQIALQPTADSVDFFQVLDADGGDPILNVDSTNEAVSVKTSTNSYTFQGSSIQADLFVEADDVGGARTLVGSRISNTAGRAPQNAFIRARVGPAALQSGDRVGTFNFEAHDGTDYNAACQFAAEIDGAVSANTVPMSFLVKTSTTNSGGLTNRLRVTSGGDISVGNVATPLGKLHVDQFSSSGAKPVLYLDQADVSEEIFEFATTIGVGNAIEAVGAKALTTTHFVKVTIPGGLTRYFPVGTIA